MDVSLAAPRLAEETLDEVEWVLREEFFLGGDTVESFENDLESYFDVDHAVTLDSGTRALQIGLESVGIGEGDTVVTSPATFVATGNVILRAGATPRFVDIDLDTYGMDLTELERVVETETVDAVMPIHLYGYPLDIERIREIVGPDTPIVSDACQAHGGGRGGVKAGAMADVGGLSFYPSKNMTVAGDGGVMLTDDDDAARVARSLRDVGRSESGYEHERIGYTARLNTVNAAIGRQQLHQLDEWNERRREVATRYTDAFEELPLDLPPAGDDEVDPAWYFYMVRADDREALGAHLDEYGVETGRQYRLPVHLQPPYREMGYEEGQFPRAEEWADTLLTLPCHQFLSEPQVDHVVDTVRGYFQ
jgi:perosamine synthetase